MTKKIVILLACTLLLTEIYSLFPKGVYKFFYPFSPHSDNTIRWYVADMVNKFLWVLTIRLWILTLPKKHDLKPILWMILIYRGMDLVVYPLNASHAGSFYGIVYIPIISYAVYITFKREFWSIFEWLYSKTKGNGNNDIGD